MSSPRISRLDWRRSACATGGRRATLTDDEVQRASNELGLGDKPQITIGGERLVTAETGQQLVERRVGTKVIRRRAAAPSAADSR